MAAVLPLYTPRIAPRSHSCTRVGAATSAFPLPSSCAKRPGKPGRFARICRLHHVKNAVPGPQKKPVLLQATGLVAKYSDITGCNSSAQNI